MDAETVARGVQDGMLAVGAKGTPYVAYVRGPRLVIATRVAQDRWRAANAAAVSKGSSVMAFKVGGRGPVALVQSADDRTLVLVRPQAPGWQRIRLVGGLPARVVLGWPGLALDGTGLPVVAYTRLDRVTQNSQLMLARVDARGRVRSQRITAEGFPQSYVPPPAAPVFVRGRVHVIQSYGYKGVVGTIEWYPQGRTWTGLFIDVGLGEFPIGPIFGGSSSGTVYAAWSQSLLFYGYMPVTLVVRGRSTTSEIVLDRAFTTALALPRSGPEIAANEWVGANELGLEGEDQVWAATVADLTSRVELDGVIAGLAAPAGGGRDLLLALPAGLSWFRSPRALAMHVTIEAQDRPDGSVSVTGEVSGVDSGRVTLFRERPGRARTAIARPSLTDGTFSFVDRPPLRPVLYRAVYTDPVTGIPYGALLRTPVS